MEKGILLENIRRRFFIFCGLVALVNGVGPFLWTPHVLWSLIICGPIIGLGCFDMLQKKHAIWRNFPVVGHLRYLLEEIGPELHQYFIEDDQSGRPFNRDVRSLAYQRAKGAVDTRSFGTQLNVYSTGYEWVNHSAIPLMGAEKDLRIRVGGPDCKQPYNASLLNISAMSYGALSTNAIRALNSGAKLGGFAHNTGEGGISPYHLENGGDLIWQIGTGYFGCRTPEGLFSPEQFAKKAATPEVKMIELKISQGAKPGHGGVLPAEKINDEIAAIRSIPKGQDCLSPPFHQAFNTPLGLCQFIQELRDLSKGKPIGFKMAIGKRREFLAICKAIHETGIAPDFITIDGGEGGTGAAPVEFSNHIGCPLTEALIFVHNALVGFNLRNKIRVIASGRIMSGFDMVSRLCIGADMCNSARGFMLSLGCIQALKCNRNTCPTGVATQDPSLVQGLVPEDKGRRVYRFHEGLIEAASEMIGAMGLKNPEELRPWHLMHRVNPYKTQHYGELYEYIEDGSLLQEPLPESYARACQAARSDSFGNPYNYTPSLTKND